MRKAVIGFLAVVSMMMVSVGCASIVPPPSGVKVAQLPDPKPGSKWLIRQLDGKWMALIELVAIENNEFVVSINGRMGRYSRKWNRLENVDDSKNIRDVYSPDNGFLEFPLYPGRKWIVNVSWTGRRGDMSGGTFSVGGEAKDWMELKITAGTFVSIPVEVQIGYTLERCWYAPAMERLAKCVFPYQPDKSWEVVWFRLADS